MKLVWYTNLKTTVFQLSISKHNISIIHIHNDFRLPFFKSVATCNEKILCELWKSYITRMFEYISFISFIVKNFFLFIRIKTATISAECTIYFNTCRAFSIYVSRNTNHPISKILNGNFENRTIYISFKTMDFFSCFCFNQNCCFCVQYIYDDDKFKSTKRNKENCYRVFTFICKIINEKNTPFQRYFNFHKKNWQIIHTEL